MYGRLCRDNTIDVQTMIDILDCDVKTLNSMSEDELDTPVSFVSNFCGVDKEEYICTIRDIKYTYKFCKRLLEMCRDAGYIK